MPADGVVCRLGDQRRLETHNTLGENIGELYALNRQTARFRRRDDRVSLVFRSTEIAAVREHHAALAMISGMAVKTFEVVRRTKIVGILNRNPLSLRMAHAQITRGGRSSILLIQISKARAKKTLERRASIIRRSVV